MNRIDADIKIDYVDQYLRNEISQCEIVRRLGVSLATVQQWIRNYEIDGPNTFLRTKYKKYSTELKRNAVAEYLLGKSSQGQICKKYGILSRSRLQKWIMQYNNHKDIKSSGTGGSALMNEGRKTTFDERIDIINYCITHDRNYSQTAEKFHVSYQQVRNYVVKYEAKGVDGLIDRRGIKKAEDEMSEVEKLHAKIKVLEAEKERAEMEVTFLKKLGQIERRRT